MSLSIYVMGKKVRVMWEGRPIQFISDHHFVLGLLTDWCIADGEVRIFGTRAIAFLTAPDDFAKIGPTQANNSLSRIRKAKDRIVTLLRKETSLDCSSVEEFLSKSKVDVRMFRMGIASGVDERICESLLLYDVNLLAEYSGYVNKNHKECRVLVRQIRDMRTDYDVLFAQGVQTLLDNNSLLFLDVMKKKGRQLASSPELLKAGWDREKLKQYQTQINDFRVRQILSRRPASTPNTINKAPSLPTLPGQLTSFVGRQAARTSIANLLASCRLITLTGSGGIGKTRLALQVADDVVDDYSRCIYLVKLESTTDPATLVQVVAKALGLMEQPGKPIVQTLIDHLEPRRLLLILDNCEHLIAACGHMVDMILRNCLYLTILATSRQPLHVEGENIFEVPPLSIPEMHDATPLTLTHSESAQLFIERARMINPGYAVTEESAILIAELCRKLDGIALELEFAAALTRMLSLDLIMDKLVDRFQMLRGGTITSHPRQQTLRALVDWSYDLLSPSERTLLSRLSVFSGGWTLEAVDRVCVGGDLQAAEILKLLTALFDKSMVTAEQKGATFRYRLRETVLQYANEKLASSKDPHQYYVQHRNYFIDLAEEAEKRMVGVEQALWLNRLDREHENLLATLERCLGEMALGRGLNLCGALQAFWGTRGYISEGREWCERALQQPGAQERTKERAKVLNGAGGLAYYQGDYTAAKVHHEESLSIRRELEDPRGIAISLNNLGLVVHVQGDCDYALTCHGESLSIRRKLDDAEGVATSLNNLALVACSQGVYAFSFACHIKSLSIRRKIKDPEGIAYSLNGLGLVAYYRGDYETARTNLEKSLEMFKEMSDRRGAAYSLNGLGLVAQSQGDYVAARASLGESLRLFQMISDRMGIAESLNAFAGLAAAREQPERASHLWGAAEALRQEIRAPMPPNERDAYDRAVSTLCAAMGEVAFRTAWDEGRALSIDEAVDVALAVTV